MNRKPASIALGYTLAPACLLSAQIAVPPSVWDGVYTGGQAIRGQLLTVNYARKPGGLT